MKKRDGESLIGILIALLIIVISITITVLPSNTVNRLKKESVIKSHIYDLAYSYAEEQMSTSTILFKDSNHSNEVKVQDSDFEITFVITVATNTRTFFGKGATEVNLSVAVKGEEDDYKVEMLLFPKQK